MAKMKNMLTSEPIEDSPESGVAVTHGPGAAQINESTPMEQRTNEPKADLSDGPKLGKIGEYQPAAYSITQLVGDRKHGQRKRVLIREDR